MDSEGSPLLVTLDLGTYSLILLVVLLSGSLLQLAFLCLVQGRARAASPLYCSGCHNTVAVQGVTIPPHHLARQTHQPIQSHQGHDSREERSVTKDAKKRAAAKNTFDRLGMHKKHSSIVEEARALENIASPSEDSPEEQAGDGGGMEALTPINEEEIINTNVAKSKLLFLKRYPHSQKVNSVKKQNQLSLRKAKDDTSSDIFTDDKRKLDRVRVLSRPGQQTPVARTPKNASRVQDRNKFLKVPPSVGGKVVPILPTKRVDKANNFVGDLSLLQASNITKASFNSDDLNQLAETSFVNENIQVINGPNNSIARVKPSPHRETDRNQIYSSNTTLKGDEFKNLAEDMKRTISRGSDDVFTSSEAVPAFKNSVSAKENSRQNSLVAHLRNQQKEEVVTNHDQQNQHEIQSR